MIWSLYNIIIKTWQCFWHFTHRTALTVPFITNNNKQHWWQKVLIINIGSLNQMIHWKSYFQLLTLVSVGLAVWKHLKDTNRWTGTDSVWTSCCSYTVKVWASCVHCVTVSRPFDSLTHEQLQEVMSLHELTSLTHRCVCTCSLTVFLLRNTRQTHQCGVTNHRLTLCLDRYVTYINQTLIRISRTVHVLFTSLFPAVLHLSGTPNPWKQESSSGLSALCRPCLTLKRRELYREGQTEQCDWVTSC